MTSSIALRAFCAATFFTLWGSLTARADIAPQPTPTPPEIGHVVTSDRADETLHNAARTTYVVTKADIIRRGFRTITDALEDIPGVNIFRYGGIGALGGIGIRGSTTNQVLVLINGLPAGGAQTGSLDLDAISTSGVERIEVVEGGGSTLYGSRSIGGVVNIITHPLQGQPTVDLRSGTFGDQLVRVESRNFSFERAVGGNTFAFPGGSEMNADSRTTDARFVFERPLGGLNAELSGGISDHHLGAPGPLGFVSATSRQNTLDKDIELSLTHERDHAVTTLQFGGTLQQLEFRCNTPVDPTCFNAPAPGATPPPPFASYGSEGRAQVSFRNVVTQARSRFIYGFDLARGVARVDDGNGTPTSISTHGFAQTGAYFQENWIFSSVVRGYAGLRAERDGGQGREFSPSLGGVARLSPAMTLKANYATAFRAPNAAELYFPGFSNPTLKPERTRVGDITLLAPNVLGGASLGWFSSSSHNLIALDQTFTPQNIQRASIAGFVAQLQTIPVHGVYARASATDLYRALCLHQDPKTFVCPGSDAATNADTRLSGAGPVLSVTAELGFRGEPDRFVESAGIIARNQGLRHFGFGDAEAYTRVDAFVRMRLSKDAVLSLRTYNLGNEAIQDVPEFPQPGRALVLELSNR
ncbi:MAG: hypothetical protein DLM50_06900 [Candidatus Meridianibacter frigidus]|nr:MAG: hypothetical protein DLM50_06900 [Candidatus Eremiobacteraeota bacterium]